jgi:phage gpG-like protein
MANNRLLENLRVDLNISPDLQNLMDNHADIAPEATKLGLRRVTKAGSKQTKNRIKSLGLVKTGALVKSVRGSTTNKKSYIGTSLWYARFLEKGAKPHKIKAKRAKGLFIFGKFVKSVQHPGIRPYEMFEDTFNDMQNRGEVQSLFYQGVMEAIEELSRR